MRYSEDEINDILLIVSRLDYIEPFKQKAFDEYARAKRMGYSSMFVSSMILLGVFSGNYEIKEAIGTLGVGIMPFLFIGGLLFLSSKRKVYGRFVSQSVEEDLSLRKYDLSYLSGRAGRSSTLYFLSSDEEVTLEQLKELR